MVKELRLSNGNIEFRYLDNLVGIYKPRQNTFIKFRKENNIFRKYNGLAISFNILNRLRLLSCDKIIILLEMNNNTTRRYETTVTKYLDEGILYSEGGDIQRILSFDRLSIGNLKNY